MTNLKSNTPILVIGAGIAGTSLALRLAALGIPCNVIDRNTEYRPQFRGEIIQPYGVLLLREVGLLDSVAAMGGSSVNRFVTLFQLLDDQPRVESVLQSHGPLPGIAATCRHHILYGGLRRALRSARGVDLWEGWRVTALSRATDGRWLATLFGPAGRRSQLTATLVVGADGVRSLLHGAADFGIHTAGASTWLLGVVQRCNRPQERSFHFYVDREWAAYLFPVGPDIRRASIHMPADAVPASRVERKRLFAQRLDEAARRLGVDDPESATIEPLQAVPAPVLRTDRCWQNGLCLVGDAAGTVNPVTGHGLTLACHDARRLAEAIADSSESELFDPSAVGDRLALPNPYREVIQDFSDTLVEACFSPWDEKRYRELAAGLGAAQRLPLLRGNAPLLERLLEVQERLGALLSELCTFGRSGGLSADDSRNRQA